MALTRIIDTWTTNNYRICSESEVKEFRNESNFQSIYSNIKNNPKLSPKILCVIEGRWSKDNAESVNGRFYGKFWRAQLAKEQTQFLLRKGLMYMMFGHVDRGIEDKDVEKGLICGIVTHLQVIEEPTVINDRQYDRDDLFGRAIIITMGGANVGESVYSLLSVGSEISISSRGLGEYIIGETHTCEDGTQIPIMNPETYELETFDFTRLPGISCAEVHMVKDNLVPNDMPNDGLVEEDSDDFTFESLETDEKTLNSINESVDSLIFSINKKENTMPKLDTVKIQQVLEDANAKIASLQAQLESAEKERDDAKAKADELEKKVDEKTETVEAGTQEEPSNDNAEGLKEEVKQTKPEPTEVDTTELSEVTTDTVGADSEELNKFKEIAESPEELKDTLEKVQEALDDAKKDAEELKQTKQDLECALADAKRKDEELEEKDKEIKDAEQTLESYVALGSISELKAIVESNKKLVQESRNQKLIQFTEHYSVKKGITQEAVKRIIESSKSIKAARQVLDALPNVPANKGLYSESKIAAKKTTPEFTSFAESMINRMENRRNRTYC